MGARGSHCSGVGAQGPEDDGRTYRRLRDGSDENRDGVNEMLHWASKELREGDLQRNGYELDKNEQGEAVIGLRLEISKVGGNLDTSRSPRGWGGISLQEEDVELTPR